MKDGGETSAPRPSKAAYLETPYESPARVGNGASAAMPADMLAEHKEIKEDFRKASMARPSFSFEEEAPKTGNDQVIDAVRKVHAIVTRRIAYHEHEAKRLRECLAPFAAMGRQVAQESVEMPEGVKQLLELASKLDNGE
jgi:hypothetical protein